MKDIKPIAENAIQEEDEEGVDDGEHQDNLVTMKPPYNANKLKNYVQEHKQPKQKPIQYKWRIDLSKTEPFWVGWFQGMSQKFIDLHVRKVLLLANLTMDTALTRAQMEGL